MKEQGIIHLGVSKTKLFRGTVKLGATGLGDPILNVTPFESEIGTVIPTRVSPGWYELNNPLLLTAKTFVLYTPQSDNSAAGKIEIDTLNDKITIRSYDNNVVSNLQDLNPEDYFSFIEIRIYP